MIVGVISDSHKNVEWVEQTIEFLKKGKAEKIIHLGDDYDDADVVAHPEIVRIPGVFSDNYKHKDIPNRLILDFEGWHILITHTKKSHSNDLPGDLKPEKVSKSKEVQVILYGHTHIPAIGREGGIIYINPGHLQKSDKKGYAASFGFLDFKKGLMTAKVLDFNTKLPIFSKFFVK